MLIGVIAEETLLPLVIAPPKLTDLAVFMLVGDWPPDFFWTARSTIIGFVIPPFLDETDPLFGAENFGHTYITQDYFGIWPDLFDDSATDSFYEFTQAAQPILQPLLVIDLDFTPLPTIPVIPPIAPFVCYIDIDIFYPPGFQQGLGSALFSNDDVIRAQIVHRDGDPFTLLSDLFIDMDRFYAPSPSQALSPLLFADIDVIYAAVQGVSPLRPGVFSSDDAIFVPAVSPLLLPSRVFDTEAIIGPTVGTPGRMGLFVDDDLFWSATVQLPPISPPLFVDADTFFVPVIASNPAIVPIDPFIDFIDQFYPAGISQNLGLAPNLWIEVDDIKSIPHVIMGLAGFPPLVDDSALDTIPAVQIDSIDGAAPVLFVDIDVFYSPFEMSANPLPPLLSDDALVEHVYAPTITQYSQLTPSAFVDVDTFYSPTISAGAKARTLTSSRAGLSSVIVTESIGKTVTISNIGVVT
jgi:hypothetical protein